MQYICTFCKTFVFDEKIGDKKAKLEPGTLLMDIPENRKCPVCGQPKRFLKPISKKPFNDKKIRYDSMPVVKKERDGKDVIDHMD